MSITVIAIDNVTGDRAEFELEPGNYVVVTAQPCHLAGEVHHAGGTSVLTLKGRRANLLTTVEVDQTPVETER